MPNSAPERGSGLRWRTTTSSALADIEKAEPISRKSMVENLRERKQANTKTSISFGNNKIDYISDLHDGDNAVKGSNPSERAADLQRAKAMKANLTKTNFHLAPEGEQDEISEYIDRYRKWEAEGYKREEKIEQSHLQLGNANLKPEYLTINGEAMKFHGNSEDLAQKKADIEAMKKNLRKHNFSIGDGKTGDYQSDYQRGYGPKPGRTWEEQNNEKTKIRQVIDDTRKAHFNFGQDDIEYVSNTHLGQSQSAGATSEQNAENAQKAAEIRKKLQKQSIKIMGDGGTEYGTTAALANADITNAPPVDRGQMQNDLKNRKQANTKTSISFGNAKVDYLSDLRASEDAVKGANLADKAKDKENAKIMKANLTRTNFQMGPGGRQEEISEYIHRYKKFEVDQMKIERPKESSSINFGNEKPDYHSINSDAMKNHTNDMQDFAKSKEDVERLKKGLRKHNFEIGASKKMEGQSEYDARYNPLKAGPSYEEVLAEKARQKEVVRDSRAAHYEFGRDPVDYVSNTHLGQSQSAGATSEQNAENAQKAAEIRKKLQKQSIVIGDDKAFF